MSSSPASVQDPAIRIVEVSKCYPIYDRPFDRLRQFMAPRFALATGRTPRQHYREYWALHKMSCEIRRGEQIGIVGRNGAGKSTLLQIVCGTLVPTTGDVAINGRVAALLELGAGFNPEFTGRENVILNAGILGLTADEIDQRMDAILAFADIGDFVEQPVKTYSSGMYMRLAFAVAINVTPDILVVDEALSVGDEAFQRKCFARIRTIRDNGGTILFVSHSVATVAACCDRAMLLDKGELLTLGTTRDVLSRYQKLLYAPADKTDEVRAWIKSHPTGALSEPDRDEAGSDDGAAVDAAVLPAVEEDAGDDDWLDPGMPRAQGVSYPALGVRITSPRVENARGRQVNVLRSGHEYTYRYTVEFETPHVGVSFGMLIKTIIGVDIGGATSAPPGEGIAVVQAGARVDVAFSFRCLLAPGTYFLNAGVTGLVGEQDGYLAREVDVMMFRVQNDPARLATGLVDLLVQPRLNVHE